MYRLKQHWDYSPNIEFNAFIHESLIDLAEAHQYTCPISRDLLLLPMTDINYMDELDKDLTKKFSFNHEILLSHNNQDPRCPLTMKKRQWSDYSFNMALYLEVRSFLTSQLKNPSLKIEAERALKEQLDGFALLGEVATKAEIKHKEHIKSIHIASIIFENFRTHLIPDLLPANPAHFEASSSISTKTSTVIKDDNDHDTPERNNSNIENEIRELSLIKKYFESKLPNKVKSTQQLINKLFLEQEYNFLQKALSVYDKIKMESIHHINNQNTKSIILVDHKDLIHRLEYRIAKTYQRQDVLSRLNDSTHTEHRVEEAMQKHLQDLFIAHDKILLENESKEFEDTLKILEQQRLEIQNISCKYQRRTKLLELEIKRQNKINDFENHKQNIYTVQKDELRIVDEDEIKRRIQFHEHMAKLKIAYRKIILKQKNRLVNEVLSQIYSLHKIEIAKPYPFTFENTPLDINFNLKKKLYFAKFRRESFRIVFDFKLESMATRKKKKLLSQDISNNIHYKFLSKEIYDIERLIYKRENFLKKSSLKIKLLEEDLKSRTDDIVKRIQDRIIQSYELSKVQCIHALQVYCFLTQYQSANDDICRYYGKALTQANAAFLAEQADYDKYILFIEEGSQQLKKARALEKAQLEQMNTISDPYERAHAGLEIQNGMIQLITQLTLKQLDTIPKHYPAIRDDIQILIKYYQTEVDKCDLLTKSNKNIQATRQNDVISANSYHQRFKVMSFYSLFTSLFLLMIKPFQDILHWSLIPLWSLASLVGLGYYRIQYVKKQNNLSFSSPLLYQHPDTSYVVKTTKRNVFLPIAESDVKTFAVRNKSSSVPHGTQSLRLG